MKVYKITFYISLAIFLFFAILSVIFNFGISNCWSSFVVNWCVGIACSAVIVVVTTIIQFKVEQKKAINKLVLIAESLIFYNQLYGRILVSDVPRNADTIKELNIIESNWRDSLENDMKKARSVLMDIEFFAKKQALLKMIKLSNLFVIAQFDKSENDYENETSLLEKEYHKVTSIIVDFAEIVVSLRANGHGKEEIEKYVQAYRRENLK